ncbi:MAG: hypothetical protein M1839_009535 [Geoglossum umbratile]|nr:MAG: hypothetical protein M1839_009535 [Geoglossum umbratile]
MFEVVFDYGEHDVEDPMPQEKDGRVWACRADPFSTFRPGFEVRTYRLCRRILMFHHFLKELGRLDYLVKAFELEYSEDTAVTYLKRVKQASFVLRGPNDPPPTTQSNSPYFVQRFPPLDLEYTQVPEVEQLKQLQVQEVDAEDAGLENVPEGLRGSYQWLDLLCEGVNGIFFADPGGEWYYKRNLSAGNVSVQGIPESTSSDKRIDIKKPKFGPLERVGSRPSLHQSPNFLDLDGNGRLQLAITDGPTPGFYRSTSNPATTTLSTEGLWEPFQPFGSWPVIDLNDPNLRYIDLTGDGKADMLISYDDVFVWYESLGESGFAPSGGNIPLALDEERGPRILFSDPTETIHLADFSGDGMVDIGRVRNGEICYWPNMGYGRFGAKVVMDNAPVFAHEFSFRRLMLGDIDGSGTTDLVYFHGTGATLYFNSAGNSWSEPLHIDSLVPAFDSLTTVAAVDLLGSGTLCLVWSSSHPTDPGRRSLRFVDLMGGQKPHLLSKVVNNRGKETRFIHCPSTTYYLQDLEAGTPWATRLPYPHHCIDRIIHHDKLSRLVFSRRYRYHHGYFDGAEREFRGFGMVEEWDTEQPDLLDGVNAANLGKATYVSPKDTKTWFHTGAFTDHERLSRAFASEYWREPDDPNVGDHKAGLEEFFSRQLRDFLPANREELSEEELREASRALSGSLLRTEVYADDGPATAEPATPYWVVDAGNSVRIVQARGQNPYGVFQVFERERLAYYYERETKDPRVEHMLVLDVDEFGNVLQSAAVLYGRKTDNESPDFEARDQLKQREMLVTYTQNEYTNPVREVTNYRVPQPSRVRQWQISKLTPTNASLGRFTPAEFDPVKGIAEIPFDQPFDPSLQQRRLLQHVETLYRRNNLSGILPFGTHESLGLLAAEYRLCLTSSMVSSVFGEKLPPAAATDLYTKGGYVDLKGDGDAWIPTLRRFYHYMVGASPTDELLSAKSSFFSTQRVQDEFGGHTILHWDSYFLSPVNIRDPLTNTTSGVMDYRTLQLRSVTDANGNKTEVAWDAAGVIVGLAIGGKDGQLTGDTLDGFRRNLTGDEIKAYFQSPIDAAPALLAGASSRYIYDPNSYLERGASFPDSTSTIARIFHRNDKPPQPPAPGGVEPIQLSISYVDGSSRVIQTKALAEPPARASGSRWRGTGWAVFNNKGLAVQTFQPFFDDTHAFRFDRREGVSSIHIYDPLARSVGIIFPDMTWNKETRDAWQVASWDVNDTVTRAIKMDEDIGEAMKFFPEGELEESWYDARKDGKLGVQEQKAASKAKAHANTPTITYFGSGGRAVLVVRDNGSGGRIPTRTTYDITGNTIEIRDGLDRATMAYRYNMAGHALYTQSIDSGQKWEFVDIRGKSMLSWDAKGNRLRTEYDELRRPVRVHSQVAGRESLAHKTTYGEGHPDPQAHNLRGKIYQEFDQAGTVTHPEWDLNGNALVVDRQFARDYKTALDWTGDATVELEPSIHRTIQNYDALGRVIATTHPDQSVVKNIYNQGGFLHAVTSSLKGEGQEATFLSSSEYDAHGRVTTQVAGNNTTTANTYDPITQRLANRAVVRQQGNVRTTAQNLTYTYDPIGNVIFVRNDAEQAIFFRNGVVEPHNEYTYDALYRLTEATGREHVGQTKGAPSGPAALPSRVSPTSPTAIPGDGGALVRYVEQYAYDLAGNVTSLRHQLSDPKFSGWTRRFSYATDGGRSVNNRLMSTTVGSTTESYTYDANGNMASLPHLSRIRWDCYVYDGDGQRVRKVTERQAAADTPNGPTKLQEHLTIGSFDLYRKYGGDGKTITLECETLHIGDDHSRLLALVERWSGEASTHPNLPSVLLRFQIRDHLSSINLELSSMGEVISHEEFSPYGPTTYSAVSTVTPKRYRYSSKELDSDSNSLYYFGHRYYIPWLSRWLNPDPIGIGDGLNVYEYVGGNPVSWVDEKGLCKNGKDEMEDETSSSEGSGGSSASGWSADAGFYLLIAAGKLDPPSEQVRRPFLTAPTHPGSSSSSSSSLSLSPSSSSSSSSSSYTPPTIPLSFSHSSNSAFSAYRPPSIRIPTPIRPLQTTTSSSSLSSSSSSFSFSSTAPIAQAPARDEATFQRHHLFPKRPAMAAYFRSIGIEPHDYALVTTAKIHEEIESGKRSVYKSKWANQWQEFITRNPVGPSTTPGQIQQIQAAAFTWLFQMMNEHKLSRVTSRNIIPYENAHSSKWQHLAFRD